MCDRCNCELYVLPPIQYFEHVIAGDVAQARAAGRLFVEAAATLGEQRQARRATLDARVAKAAAIVGAHNDQAIVWCDLNDEGDALERAIAGSVQVAGKDSEEEQEQKIAAFLDGSARVLIGKGSQLGFGLNFQNACEVVFCGVSHSFELYYQAIRRVWRFGQDREVRVHVISSELEGRVLDNIKRKEADAAEMASQMVAAMRATSMEEIRATGRQHVAYAPNVPMRLPTWLRGKEAA